MAAGSELFVFRQQKQQRDVDDDDDNAVKWTNKKLTALIQEYWARPILWNSRLPEYSNKKRRFEALMELECIFDVPAQFIRHKINTLRTQFLAEQKKIKTSIESGKGLYTPKWWAFNHMKFLLLPGDPRNNNTATIDQFHPQDMSPETPEAEDSGLLETSDDDVKPIIVQTESICDSEAEYFRKRRKHSEEDSGNYMELLDATPTSVRRNNINSFCCYLESEMLAVENQEQLDLFKIEVQLLLLKAKKNALKASFL